MKRKTCFKCHRPLTVCFCHCLKDIDNDWPVWILQDPAEKKHAIGTAQIAELCLNNIKNINTETAQYDTDFLSNFQIAQPVLVYPGENSFELDQLKPTAIRPLLFLDGSWRKTRKMFYDFPQLNELPRLNINPDTASRYRIRKAPNESAISTLEAIVYVLSALDNNAEKYQPMLGAMDWMIEKQIEYMGDEVYLKNYNKF